MTNNNTSSERLSMMLAATVGYSAGRGDYASVEINAALLIAVLTELQEYRKASKERVIETDSDADYFTISRLMELVYGAKLKGQEQKLLARFMLDMKQRYDAP